MPNIQHAVLIWLALIGVAIVGFVITSAVARHEMPGRAALRRARKARKRAAVTRATAAQRAAIQSAIDSSQGLTGAPTFVFDKLRLDPSDTVVLAALPKIPAPRRSPESAAKKPITSTRPVSAAKVAAARVATERAELGRFADEVGVAAERAAASERRKHADWVAVQRTTEAAWRAYELADAAVQRLERAAIYPLRAEKPLPTAEIVARRRYLDREVRAAFTRGELSTPQFTDAMAHRNGWDPRLHPFEVQLKLRRAARDRRLCAYQQAAAVERDAWHEAERAYAAKRSLADEAFKAQLGAQRVVAPAQSRGHALSPATA